VKNVVLSGAKERYMDAARYSSPNSRAASSSKASHLIDAAQFQKLLVSHRRLVRADRRSEALRGLQDLDTGELFLTDERRLLNARRELCSASN
jgi:hypothetical protein